MIASRARPWIVAVLAVGGAAALRVALDPWLGATIPFGPFLFAVGLSVFISGLWSGIIATVLSAITAAFLFLEPELAFEISSGEDAFALAFFFVMGLAISVLGFRVSRSLRFVKECVSRQRATFDYAGVGIVEVDQNDRFIAINDCACEILRRSRDEVLAMNVHELTWPEDKELSDRLNREVREGRRDRVRYEKRYIRGDGSPVWVYVSVSAVRDEHCGLQRSITTMEDISQRKEAELALRESERRFRGTFENASVGITQTDRGGKCILVNQKLCDILRISRSKLLGMCLQDLTHPDDREADWNKYQALMRGELDACRLEKRYVRQDGSIVWLEIERTLQRDEAGEPSHSINIVQDITDRRMAEERLLRSEERLREMVEASPFPAIIHREDGKIAVMNAAWSRLSGYTIHDIPTIEAWTKRAYGEPFAIEEYMDTDHLNAMVPEGEHVIRAADGTTRVWDFFSGRLGEDSEGRKLVLRTAADVTERKKAEETCRVVFEQAAIGMGRVDSKGARWIDVNDAFCRMLGYSAEELKATPWPKIAHPNDAGDPLIPFREMAAGELENYTVERRFIHKQGHCIWVRLTLSLVRDQSGSPDYEIAIIEDITERKRVEQALRENDERFRAIFESSSDCILVWDRQYNYLYANQAAIDHVQTTRDKVIGRNIRDGLGHVPDFMHLWMKRVDQAFATGEPFRVEDAVPIGERLVYSESQISPIRDSSGNVFAVGVVYRDVTQRKQVEEALRQSEEFYRKTLESIPGMVFTTQPDGYCDYQSQQWVEFTGVPMSEHLGEGWNKLLHPDDQPRALAAWRAAVEEKASYDLEYRVRRYDGTYEWFKVRGNPIRDEAGRIVRWFGVLANIEELKRVEQALNEAKEDLARANAAKDQFLAVLSHELRTPLTPVLAAVSLIKRRADVPTAVLDSVEVIRRNVSVEARA